MGKFLYSLILLALGMIVGQAIRYLGNKNILKDMTLVDKQIKTLQKFILLAIYPVITAASFWIVKMTDLKLLLLPFIGAAALIIGGIFALAGSKVFKHDRKKTGSMFVAGSFTNLGAMGGLICFILFGEISYPFVSMYTMFRDFVYYGVGYPVARLFGDKQDEKDSRSILKLFLDPFILVSFTSIVVGISLNMSGITRPPVFSSINGILIPLASFLLVVTVGFYMRFGAVSNYIKECLMISLIKFLIIPVSITTTAYILGFGNLYNGLVLKVILIMSSMPPAINSLIPPQLYGLDTDLANSVWLFNTGALLVVLPIIYAVQTFLL